MGLLINQICKITFIFPKASLIHISFLNRCGEKIILSNYYKNLLYPIILASILWRISFQNDKEKAIRKQQKIEKPRGLNFSKRRDYFLIFFLLFTLFFMSVGFLSCHGCTSGPILSMFRRVETYLAHTNHWPTLHFNFLFYLIVISALPLISFAIKGENKHRNIFIIVFSVFLHTMLSIALASLFIERKLSVHFSLPFVYSFFIFSTLLILRRFSSKTPFSQSPSIFYSFFATIMIFVFASLIAVSVLYIAFPEEYLLFTQYGNQFIELNQKYFDMILSLKYLFD